MYSIYHNIKHETVDMWKIFQWIIIDKIRNMYYT